MKDLSTLRGNINEIDNKIVELWAQRMECSLKIAEYKKENNLPVFDEKREKELLSKIHYRGGYSLYIGIPFCPTTCLYCSFTSYPICSWKNRMDEYLEAVFKEIDYVAEAYDDKILDTVRSGGVLSKEEEELVRNELKNMSEQKYNDYKNILNRSSNTSIF